MNPTARPTLRCLHDLLPGVEDVGQRRAIEEARWDDLPPLSQVDHPLIGHVVALFNGEDAEVERESISSARDPLLYKTKSGQWRGAVYLDPQEQPWLIAAGLRRQGDRSDFYTQFARQDHGQMLPSSADRDLLKIETASRRLSLWEQRIRFSTITAVAAAARADDGKCRLPIDDPGGKLAGHLGIEVVRLPSTIDDAHVTPAELQIEVSLGDWSNDRLRRAAFLEIARVVAPTEDAWDVIPLPDGSQLAVADVTDARILQIIAANDLDDTSPTDGLAPSQIEPTGHAHYVPAAPLTEALVTGVALRARCGQWFVPRHDPGNRPICPECDRQRPVSVPEPQ